MREKATDQYSLKTPCGMCPFRSDKPFPLRGSRAEEIAENLESGAEFHCHKTVDYTEAYDDDDNPAEGKTVETTKVCAGALITMEKAGQPNQMMRIAERLGLYDYTSMNLEAPVYDSLDEWVEHMHMNPNGI